jgi:outer membrane protein OmpA-like peptidoglycan-associated protein
MRHALGPVATWTPRLAMLICLVIGVAGCTLGGRHPSGSGVTVTQRAAPSAFVAVVPGSAAGPSLARLIASTIRPGEDIDVLRAGATGAVLAAGSAPAPAVVTIPGRPVPPGDGATPFLEARYRQRVSLWQGELRGARSAVAVRTGAALAALVKILAIAGKVARLPSQTGPSASLAGECAVAASALAGLDQAAGASFGDRRVVVLYPLTLNGTLPAGELTGNDVIVVMPFLASAADLAAAQASLVAAGAARASIVGPEFSAAQLAELVTLGLSAKVVTESLSGTALFANDSARLLPGAIQVLTPVIALLREPGAAAVINGYASTPGDRQLNDELSYARAAAVAAFLEAHGVPASSLDVIGHGASDLVASGPSSANRRVVVVIEEPEVP